MMAGAHIRKMADGEQQIVAQLLAAVFDDKREAVMGESEGWPDVVAAFISEYSGMILVATWDGGGGEMAIESDGATCDSGDGELAIGSEVCENSKLLGALAVRNADWVPGTVTIKAVVSKIGVLKSLKVRKKLKKLLLSLPQLEDGVGLLDAVGVLEQHRRSGLGQLLLQEAELWAKSTGMHTLSLSVKKGNTAALELYRKHGYHVSRDYSNAWGSYHYLKKKL